MLYPVTASNSGFPPELPDKLQWEIMCQVEESKTTLKPRTSIFQESDDVANAAPQELHDMGPISTRAVNFGVVKILTYADRIGRAEPGITLPLTVPRGLGAFDLEADTGAIVLDKSDPCMFFLTCWRRTYSCSVH